MTSDQKLAEKLDAARNAVENAARALEEAVGFASDDRTLAVAIQHLAAEARHVVRRVRNCRKWVRA